MTPFERETAIMKLPRSLALVEDACNALLHDATPGEAARIRAVQSGLEYLLTTADEGTTHEAVHSAWDTFAHAVMRAYLDTGSTCK